jgi:heat induced stress protein YflT
MAGKNTAAFGIFANRTAAEAAVDRLTAAGFSHQDVSVLMSDQSGSKDFAAEKNTKAPEGTTTGVTVGGITGGTLGLLAGLGALAIPGVGPLIAAGPIMGALAGLGVGGAVGGLVGALVGMGIPEYEAKRYEGRVKDGGILVSVHCDSSDEVSRAKDILRSAGGDDVASSGEKGVSSHTANTDAVVDRTTSGYDRTPGYEGTTGYTRTGTSTVDDAGTYATGTGRTGLDTTRDDVVTGDRKPIISTPE